MTEHTGDAAESKAGETAQSRGTGGSGESEGTAETIFTTTEKDSSSSEDGPAVHSKFWMELPRPMKNASGVLIDEVLYLGGGYTGNSKTDAIVCAYDMTAGKWKALPLCPLKWFTVTSVGGKLVLVGGRLTQGAKLACYTNKVAVWNADTMKWGLSMAPMLVPRMAPVVISFEDHLIAAGGGKGSLDHQAEVLLAGEGKWVCGPPLPLGCFGNTSAAVGNDWYLADTTNGIIQYADIRGYLTAATRHNNSKDPPIKGTPREGPLWRRLACNPPVVSFRIASIDSQLAAFSDPHSVNTTVHLYQHRQEIWTEIKGRFPCILSTGFLLEDHSQEGTLYVLGGEVAKAYSNQAHKLKLMTKESLKVMKRSRQTSWS